MADPVASKAPPAQGVSVLRPARHAALVAALDAAVAQDASLEAARALLLGPLTLLQALADDAPGALGDDVLAAERFRLLLALASAQLPPLASIQQVLTSSNQISGDHLLLRRGFSIDAPTPCENGIVHTGALVIIGLAAGRVGKAAGLAEPLINNVLALAVSAAPAETLGRSLDTGMSPAQVRAVLAGLGARENGQDRRLSAVIASFLADRCEQARWACLATLFDLVREDVADHPWDAAGTGEIQSVEPRDACPGQRVTIQVPPQIIITIAPPPAPAAAPSSSSAATAAQPELTAAHFLSLFPRRALDVVFAAQGRRSVARQPEAVDAGAGTVTVMVPAGAHVGWLGFADQELLALSNQARQDVRDAWTERNTENPCLRAAPVPVDAIPLLRDPPTPPRAPEARFDGGEPIVLEASLAPEVADPGETLRVRWRVEGARAVRLEPRPEALDAEGRLEFPAPTDRARVELTLVAESRCGDPVRRRLRARVRVRILRVDATQPARSPAAGVSLVPGSAGRLAADPSNRPPPLVIGEPTLVTALLSAPDARGRAELVLPDETRPMRIDAGRATITLPGRLAVDGLRGTVVFRGPDGEVEDRRDFGPLKFVPLRTRRLVVVRPAMLGRELRRVSAAERETVLRQARLRLAMEVEADEPAWVDDEDLFVDGLVEGPDVPAALALLERLNTLAARSPGMEEALFVALVPPPARQDFARVELADGARAVAVCTPNALAGVLDRDLPAGEPRTARLRIVGTVLDDSTVRLQPARVDERGAGPGAPVQTELRAVALDAAGRVLASRPVRTLTADRPARAVVLLPVTDEVTDVELRLPGGEKPPLAVVLGLCGEGAVGHDHYTVARLHRPEGAPDLVGTRTVEDEIRFDYAHTRSARPALAVEAGGARGWTPVLALSPCAESAAIPADRLAVEQGDRVRVAATDGWNTALGPERGLPLPRIPLGRVVARHAGGRRFWADVDDGEAVRWSFGDQTVTGALVTAPPGFAGDVVLTAGEGESARTDTRTLGADGRVDDRSTALPEELRHG